MPKFESQKAKLHGNMWKHLRRSRMRKKNRHPNPKNWTAECTFENRLFSDSAYSNSVNSCLPSYLGKKPSCFCFSPLISNICYWVQMCFKLWWNTQRNKATSKQLSQMNLQCHKRAIKLHFPFPLLMKRGSQVWSTFCSTSELLPFLPSTGL